MTEMKRFIAVVLAMVMTMSLLPIFEVSAAESVTYIDAVVDTDTNKVTYAEKSIAEYTIVTSDTTSMSNGWYVVKDDVTVSSRIAASGTVNIVLCDGAILTAKCGINLESGNVLNVYAQSQDSTKMGALMVSGEKYKAGIGGYYGSGGEVTINGGTVEATGGQYGAGIGGGYYGSGGEVTINGGTVEATGGQYGAGIGGGSEGSGGEVTINGGKVTATSRQYGAGIGGGFCGSGGEVTINGGTVEATGGQYGSGIGGGYKGSGGSVTINGGTVEATGGEQGSGIGGEVTINGGTVEATGGEQGSGIGGEVTINGGKVTATGGAKGSGIGGGSYSSGGEVTINGGKVEATGGDNGSGIGGGYKGSGGSVTINGGTVSATGKYYASGIGGGSEGSGGEVTIKGGTVEATGGQYGSGIGGGYKGSGGTVTIDGGIVTATGEYEGAGIGGGYKGSGGEVTINGGTVEATGGQYGSGIGGGGEGSGGTVTIDGGTIEANGGEHGAGIGGGYFGSGGTVTIDGGNVKAVAVTVSGTVDGKAAEAIGKGRVGDSSGTLKNAAGDDVSLKTYSLDGVVVQRDVSAVGEIDYGVNDVRTLDTNKLYFYLPTDTSLTQVTMANGQVFEPTNAGDEALYCAHAEVDGGFCVHCGEYFDELTEPETDDDGKYKISSLENLVWFADYVNGGNMAVNAVLENDIDATRVPSLRIGTSEKPYAGTFDGNGHAIDLKLSGKEYTALFAHVNGATIKNLTLDGTIEASGKFAAGFVGFSKGDVTIEKCLSFVVINSYVAGDGAHGGLVANVSGGTMTIDNSGFVGAIKGDKTTNCSGLVGESVGVTAITNSYVAATIAIKNSSDSSDIIARNASNVTVTNCYCLNNLTNNETGATEKSADEFESGEVAYLLNGGTTDGTQVWHQTIGTDDWPVFAGETVYYDYATCIATEKSYVNTTEPMHLSAKYVPCEGSDYNYHIQQCTHCGEKFGNKTEHEWTHTSDDDNDTITRTCNLCGATGTVKLCVEEKNYDGRVPAITFEKSGVFEKRYSNEITTSYCCEGGCKKAGKHTVTMTIGEATVSKSVTIEKKEITFTVKGYYKSYDGTNDVSVRDININGVISGEEVEVKDVDAIKVYTNGNTYGYYSVGYATGITLAGKDADNYTIKTDESGNAVVEELNGEYGGEFGIYKAMVYITPLDQQIEGEGAIDQSKYTTDLDEKFAMTGVELYDDEYGHICVSTENIKITLDDADVTANFEINANASANIERTCEGHTFNENGFCSTGKCNTYQPAMLNNNATPDDGYDDYYEIWNAGQLYWFAQQVNDYNKTEIAGKLMADIAVNPGTFDAEGNYKAKNGETLRAWTPIATSDYVYYQANFDGNGHTVSGLYCVKASGNAGFVGNLGCYELKNLVIENSYFSGTTVGAIAGGSTYGATVSSCGVGEDVYVYGSYSAGGFIGSSGFGSIKNCYSLASVKGDYYVGGFVGYNYTPIANSFTNSNCFIGANNSSYGGSADNCYYKAGDDDDYIDGTNAVSKDDFNSGKIAYLLQSGVDGEEIYDDDYNYIETIVPQVWYQTIGKDDYPVFEGEIVYYDEDAEIKYYNRVSVTVDGTKTETNGQIVLGTKNADESYSLPENVLGYYIDDDFVDAGKYEVVGGEVITTVDFNVEIVNGAQVRYGAGVNEEGKVNDGNGLRFIAQVDKSNFDGITYGMKIQAEASDNSTEVVADKWQDDDKTVFTVAVTNLATSNYNRNYTATPFVKVRYDDGTEKTVYGTNTVTRSIYYVASGLLKNGVNEEDYTLTGNATLYNVLNAYVNMVGIRLNIENDGTMTPNTTDKGKYSGDAFFEVTCVKNENVYSVTIKPVSEEFENPVKIMGYWKEFIRINNNNSTVRNMITNEQIASDGTLTFDFTMEAKESNN